MEERPAAAPHDPYAVAGEQAPVITSPPLDEALVVHARQEARPRPAGERLQRRVARGLRDLPRQRRHRGVDLPDTVYIGRHAEFPRIELPALIARRFVRIIDPAEGESEKHRAHFAYLNIFSTFTPGQVEFYVVRFAQCLRHQPDGSEDRHLNYRVGEKKEMVLERMSR